MSQEGLSLSDIHLELNTLILGLHTHCRELSSAEKKRIEGILQQAKIMIGGHFIKCSRKPPKLTNGDIPAELRCLIMHLRASRCKLSENEQERIEQVIWQAIDAIGSDFVTKERFEQLYEAGLKNKFTSSKHKKKERAG